MLLIIDCNYVAYVCAFALSRGMTYRGGRTEVVFLFLKQLFTLCENFDATQIAFCWDSRQNKRKEIYPEYKSNRRKDSTEEDQEARALVYSQFEDLKKEILPFLGFSNVFEVSGYESDDIIATLVQRGLYRPEETVVISSDADLFQLLDKCSLYSITKHQTTNLEVFQRHYGIGPLQWVMVKAIAGCGTDNVKGIVGIGEKKAIDYLTGKLNHGKMFLKIKESEDIIKRNLKLVELPFAGTPTPNIRRNNLMLSNFKAVCGIYGMDSLLEPKNLSRWQRIIERID